MINLRLKYHKSGVFKVNKTHTHTHIHRLRDGVPRHKELLRDGPRSRLPASHLDRELSLAQLRPPSRAAQVARQTLRSARRLAHRDRHRVGSHLVREERGAVHGHESAHQTQHEKALPS